MTTRRILLSTSVRLLAVLMAISVAAQQQEAPNDVPTIAKRALSAVVLIVAQDASGRPQRQGSGFVVTTDGKVVTNFHVIDGMTSAVVKFSDGAFYQVAGVTAADPDKDLAVLKIDAIGRVFPVLPLGDSERVEVGEKVLALGSPLGFENTLSDGIISAIREFGGRKWLQTTAPVSPGSSGGALLDTSGRVVGVMALSWRLRDLDIPIGQNINFAIPINSLLPLLRNAVPKPLSAMATSDSPSRTAPKPLSAIEGTYTGVWESTKFAASGAAAMTVSIEAGTVRAEIFLTGGQVSKATLVGTASQLDQNVWTVELKAEKLSLTAKGIFRSGSFVGDYRYRRALMVDRGQWILRKN